MSDLHSSEAQLCECERWRDGVEVCPVHGTAKPPIPVEVTDRYAAGIVEGRRLAAAAVRAGGHLYRGAVLIDVGLAAKLAEGVFDASSVHAEPRSLSSEQSGHPPARAENVAPRGAQRAGRP